MFQTSEIHCPARRALIARARTAACWSGARKMAGQRARSVLTHWRAAARELWQARTASRGPTPSACRRSDRSRAVATLAALSKSKAATASAASRSAAHRRNVCVSYSTPHHTTPHHTTPHHATPRHATTRTPCALDEVAQHDYGWRRHARLVHLIERGPVAGGRPVCEGRETRARRAPQMGKESVGVREPRQRLHAPLVLRGRTRARRGSDGRSLRSARGGWGGTPTHPLHHSLVLVLSEPQRGVQHLRQFGRDAVLCAPRRAWSAPPQSVCGAERAHRSKWRWSAGREPRAVARAGSSGLRRASALLVLGRFAFAREPAHLIP
jgi:hypothetical protein